MKNMKLNKLIALFFLAILANSLTARTVYIDTAWVMKRVPELADVLQHIADTRKHLQMKRYDIEQVSELSLEAYDEYNEIRSELSTASTKEDTVAILDQSAIARARGVSLERRVSTMEQDEQLFLKEIELACAKRNELIEKYMIGHLATFKKRKFIKEVNFTDQYAHKDLTEKYLAFVLKRNETLSKISES
ncbi:MAG: hypothetical protein KDC92_00815 [Bacteroidetes bacterium]|nr:hypothetical protein [Bacteroidota bacterium]